jgi:hypothetical protein
LSLDVLSTTTLPFSWNTAFTCTQTFSHYTTSNTAFTCTKTFSHYTTSKVQEIQKYMYASLTIARATYDF